jgi:hypothetical protein
VRLAVLTYAMASTVEWAFHKFDMHETDEVHILHHAETNRDMTMPDGYDITAIQFPRSASIMIAGGGVPLLAALDFVFQLNIPYWEVRNVLQRRRLPPPPGVTLRARWVTLRASLGDAESSLGDAESSLGDATSHAGSG